MVKSSSLAILMLLLFVATGYTAPFTLHGDGTLTDQDSEFMWQQQDDNTTRNWQGALHYCNNLSLAGFNNWRLPNKKELESIVDYTKYNPSIDAVFTDTKSSYYWSSSSYASGPDGAWVVIFHEGSVVDYSKAGSYYARCVR